MQNVGELLLPANERVRREWKVRAIQTFQRRERAVTELVHALERGEILEAVLAEVAEPVRPDERCRRGSNEYLPAVADSRDPRGAVHVVSDVSLIRDERRPCVETDADVDRAGRQRFRERSRGGESAWSCREGEEEGVALGVDLDATFGGEVIIRLHVLGVQSRLEEDPRVRQRSGMSPERWPA